MKVIIGIQMRAIKTRRSQGFTLIELLVVIAILSILAAIAVPQFYAYKARGFDARSLETLREAAIAEDAYFQDYNRYADCVGMPACRAALPGFDGNLDVNIEMSRVAAAPGVPEYFIGQSYHPNGIRNSAANAWMWNSRQGGMQ